MYGWSWQKTKGVSRGKCVIQEQKWFIKHLFHLNSLPKGYDILFIFRDYCEIFQEKCRIVFRMYASTGKMNYALSLYYNAPSKPHRFMFKEEIVYINITLHHLQKYDKYTIRYNNLYSKCIIKHILFEEIHEEIKAYAWKYERAYAWCFDTDLKAKWNI